MDKNDWLANRLAFIRELKNPTESQKALLELAAISEPTKQEVKQLDALVRLEKINVKAEEAKTEVARLMAERREQARRARTHELIELGGIVTMVDFPTDRGVLTGALLWALDQMKTDTAVEGQLKTRGDTFIAAREAH
ncbi:conjugal transfer protein TraD [Burkholderia stagnalis]